MNLNCLRSAILIFCLFFLGAANIAVAVEPLSAPLPEIDAQRFDAKAIEKSKTGRIYLFESARVLPKTGSLILVYNNDKPAMAFRVLKNDPLKKQFVGKRVRRYDETSELTLNESYSAIEKLADVLPPPPSVAATTPSANEDLDDAATKKDAPPKEKASTTPEPTPTPEMPPPAAEDAELDSSSVAALNKIDENDTSTDQEEQENIEIEETTRLNPYNNIFSVSGGYFGNSANFSFSPIIEAGMSVSYYHTLINNLFVSKKTTQDAFGLEFGAIYYRVVNRDSGNDIYTMFPFYATALYQIHLSPTFSFNLYGGLQYDYMVSAVNPGASLAVLQGPQPDLGIGFFYGFGPQWLLRADLGWDRITAGLCIKW